MHRLAYKQRAQVIVSGGLLPQPAEKRCDEVIAERARVQPAKGHVAHVAPMLGEGVADRSLGEKDGQSIHRRLGLESNGRVRGRHDAIPWY